MADVNIVLPSTLDTPVTGLFAVAARGWTRNTMFLYTSETVGNIFLTADRPIRAMRVNPVTMTISALGKTVVGMTGTTGGFITGDDKYIYLEVFRDAVSASEAWKINPTGLVLEDWSPVWPYYTGAPIWWMARDTDGYNELYCMSGGVGDTGPGLPTLAKLDIRSMEWTGYEDLGANIVGYSCIYINGYVFYCDGIGGDVSKVDRSDMSLAASTVGRGYIPTRGIAHLRMAGVDYHLLTEEDGFGTGGHLKVIAASDLSEVSSHDTGIDFVNSIAPERILEPLASDYIFIGGESFLSGNPIKALNAQTLAILATKDIAPYTCTSLAYDGEYLYSYDENRILQLDPVTLSTIATLNLEPRWSGGAAGDGGDYMWGGDCLFTLPPVTSYGGFATAVKVEAESILSQLRDELVLDYDTGGGGTWAQDILEDLLLEQEGDNQITLGTVDPALGLEIREYQAKKQDILSAILQLRDTVGGYYTVNNDRELDWASDLGEDKGQQIRYRKNLKGITRIIEYANFGNRLYCYGALVGGARITLTDAGYPTDYIEDPASQALYGIVTRRLVNDDIFYADSLLEWAVFKLDEMREPRVSYTIEMVARDEVDPNFNFDTLQLGSIVRVIDEDLGVDIEARIVRIRYPDLLHPERIEVEIANKKSSAVDLLIKPRTFLDTL